MVLLAAHDETTHWQVQEERLSSGDEIFNDNIWPLWAQACSRLVRLVSRAITNAPLLSSPWRPDRSNLDISSCTITTGQEGGDKDSDDTLLCPIIHRQRIWNKFKTNCMKLSTNSTTFELQFCAPTTHFVCANACNYTMYRT